MRTKSYCWKRISETWSVDARMRPVAAARATASMCSSRSSNGVRFQRLHRGQTTHSRPFHSSNAMRRPTPRPEGPPSPSNDALQKAQLRNIYEVNRSGAREEIRSEEHTSELQ